MPEGVEATTIRSDAEGCRPIRSSSKGKPLNNDFERDSYSGAGAIPEPAKRKLRCFVAPVRVQQNTGQTNQQFKEYLQSGRSKEGTTDVTGPSAIRNRTQRRIGNRLNLQIKQEAKRVTENLGQQDPLTGTDRRQQASSQLARKVEQLSAATSVQQSRSTERWQRSRA